MAAYLDAILSFHRARAGMDRRDPEVLLADALLTLERDPPRSLTDAVRVTRAGPGPGAAAVIAEIKRRSPSRGVLAANLDPAAVAVEYEKGGAAAISVLTDRMFFGGSADDLAKARSVTTLPVLRKDFLVSDVDVIDARLMGADAVLLIVAALSQQELCTYLELARQLGMDALVEVHDATEMNRAALAGASLIGVNQRDLRSFAEDRSLAATLGSQAPKGAVLVAESAIRSPEDAARAFRAGFDAVLVGEALVRSGDRAGLVRALTRARQGAGRAASGPRT